MTATQRMHSLDAVRGFALLLGIVLHATMSFFLPVPAADSSQSTTLAVSFYVIHMFRMSLFFLIAGFFAHMVFHRRGLARFARDRAKRILVPMTAGWVVLAPVTILVIVWGVGRTQANGPVPAAEAAQGFPLIHLWFLYYLAIFYVLAVALRELVATVIDSGGRLRAGLDRLTGWLVRGHLAPVLLGLPLVLVLYREADWAVWFGLPTPDVGLLPQLPAMAGYGIAFAFGWALNRRPELLAVWGRVWPVYLAAAAALTTICLALVGPRPDLAAPAALAGGDGLRLAYAAAYACGAWFWILGIIGVALRFCESPSPLRRYLADSSYWLYLVHLPLVFFLQVLVMDWPLHWSVKFTLVLVLATALLLASYHYWVRPTFIGEILNGRRYPRGPSPDGQSPDPAGPGGPGHGPAGDDAGPVARLAGVSKRYGDTTALAGLELAIERGELLALLGPNGAGKTTAISLWLGLLTPDEGEVRLCGGSPFETASRRDIGVMMQDVALPPELTARELIDLAASYYREPLGVDTTLELSGTLALADKRYKTLSGGQKRQVQFAVAIAGRPRLLFLDEPTVGLDVDARERMWQTIRGLIDSGCSILLTTHYIEEAESLADRVAVLASGHLIAEGSVEDMRKLVSRRQIRCASGISAEEIRSWPGVIEVSRQADFLSITAADAEAVVRRLLAADADLSRLEVRQASLAEAFTELTKEAA